MWSDLDDDDVVPILFSVIEVMQQNETTSREWVRPCNQARNAENFIINLMAELRCCPEKFCEFTSMQIETFDYLLGLIENAITKQDTNYRKSITPAERLLITLRYLATGQTFKSLSSDFHCGATTIVQIIMETCQAIWEALYPIYLSQPDVEKWISISDEFSKMWNFPNCLGAIDGKHIRIQCPPTTVRDNYKSKKQNFIHLQVVVDAHGQFIFVDVDDGFGRNCDSDVFKCSHFGKQLVDNKLNLPQKQKLCPQSNEYFNFVFVANEGYPLLTSIMRPFARKHLTDEKRIYNYHLFQAQQVVECAFNLMSEKFRIFDKVILLLPNKVKTITLAACALHNMIREREGLLQKLYVECDGKEYVAPKKIHKYIEIARPSNAASGVRSQFVQYFNSSDESVP